MCECHTDSDLAFVSTRAQVRLDAIVPDITMSQLPKIDFCDLNDLQLIGKGSYASVYKVRI